MTVSDPSQTGGAASEYEDPAGQFGEERDMTEDEIEQVTLQMIDEFASHPEDATKPEDVAGVSDEELMATDTETIVELLELGLPYATAHEDEPRYLFGLGRAALLHGDDELAKELLWQASELGSAGATAYLAFLTDDLNEVEEYLVAAAEGGFEPAHEWLQETRDALSEAAAAAAPPATVFDFNSFNLPYVIEAFHSGNTRFLADSPLAHYTYATAINDTLSDPGILWVTDESMMLEIDAQLRIAAERKLLTNPALMDQGMQIGMNAIVDVVTAMADARKRGASIQEEFHATTQALAGSGKYSLVQIQDMGKQDARRLAILYKTNKQDFRKVYAGLRQFIMEDL
jgi:hypothetical protein